MRSKGVIKLGKVKQMQECISDLRKAGLDILEIAKDLTEMFTDEVMEMDEPKAMVVELPKPPAIEEVRSALAEKTRQGYSAEVRQLLKSYGVDKLSTLSEEHYADVLKEADCIGK